MRVVCLSEYPSEEQIQRLGKEFYRNQSFGLVVGQEYLVLGLRYGADSSVHGNTVVVDYFNGDHLLGAPLCLFETKNPSVSHFWEARRWEDDSLTLWPPLFYEDYFHDRLSDYEPEPRAKFKEICDLMEREDLGEETVRRNEMIQVLREVVAKRRPGLLPLADKVGIEVLTEEQLEKLSDVISSEFVEVGLKEDGEPNSRGMVLNDIMGFLVPQECNPKGHT